MSSLHNISTSEEIKRWKRKNRGMMAAVAKHCKTSKERVRAVLYCEYYSSGGVIEGCLAELGAPGMKQRQIEAEARGPDSWTKAEVARLLKQLRKIQAEKRRAA